MRPRPAGAAPGSPAAAPGSAVPPLRLDINRAIIGAERAKDVFLLCRAYAQYLEPNCNVEAIYEDHERVGWQFKMNSNMNTMRLARRTNTSLTNALRSAMARCPMPECIITDDGAQEWYLNGELHREEGPAYIGPDGSLEWWRNGKEHRDDGPAEIRGCGTKVWYRNGERYREDGPAIEGSDGSFQWFVNGSLHREDGPAYTHPDGTKEWYLNGEKHRENGPAVIHADGTKEWWLNDERHRQCGPAVINANNRCEWWFDGLDRTCDVGKWLFQENHHWPQHEEWTDAMKIIFVLKWSDAT